MMDMNHLVLVAILLVSTPGLSRADDQVTANSGSKSKQLNFVFVLADDYGFHDIGYHGSEIKTPVLDQLAASGVKLENYYVQPICTPTRSTLMSGRYPIHCGLQHGVLQGDQDNGLPLDEPTVADKLKEAGYATHMVGKWNLGHSRKEYMPHYRGFDTFYGFLSSHGDHFNHTIATRSFGPYLDLRFNDQPIWNETGHYSTNLFTEKGIDVIKSHDANKPLFLYMAYQAVHTPLEVPDIYLEDYKDITDSNRKMYAGMVAAMDEGVGNLTKALKDEGLWDNTILIFSTDNGGQRSGANNYPLRGRKGFWFEGGVRGVAFVAGGALQASGVVNRELIHVSDWFPTLVGLAGGSLNGTHLDGVDQWETISKNSPSNRMVLLHNIDPLDTSNGVPMFDDTFDTSVAAAVRMGDYKLITGSPRANVGGFPGGGNGGPPGGGSGGSPGRSPTGFPPGRPSGFRPPPPGSGNGRPPPPGNGMGGPPANNLGQWDVPPGLNVTVPDVVDPTDKNVWLFNIAQDPTEEHDISDTHPDMVRIMLDVLANFNLTAVPARFPETDPRSDPGLHGGVWGPWID